MFWFVAMLASLVNAPATFGDGRDGAARSDPKPSKSVSLTTLIGRVAAEDGSPVATFTIAVGPGRLPTGSECVRHAINDVAGRFNVRSPASDEAWVGISADGFA